MKSLNIYLSTDIVATGVAQFVRTITGLRDRRPGNRGAIPAGSVDASLLQHVSSGSGANPAAYYYYYCYYYYYLLSFLLTYSITRLLNY